MTSTLDNNQTCHVIRTCPDTRPPPGPWSDAARLGLHQAQHTSKARRAQGKAVVVLLLEWLYGYHALPTSRQKSLKQCLWLVEFDGNGGCDGCRSVSSMPVVRAVGSSAMAGPSNRSATAWNEKVGVFIRVEKKLLLLIFSLFLCFVTMIIFFLTVVGRGIGLADTSFKHTHLLYVDCAEPRSLHGAEEDLCWTSLWTVWFLLREEQRAREYCLQQQVQTGTIIGYQLSPCLLFKW